MTRINRRELVQMLGAAAAIAPFGARVASARHSIPVDSVCAERPKYLVYVDGYSSKPSTLLLFAHAPEGTGCGNENPFRKKDPLLAFRTHTEVEHPNFGKIFGMFISLADVPFLLPCDHMLYAVTDDPGSRWNIIYGTTNGNYIHDAIRLEYA